MGIDSLHTWLPAYHFAHKHLYVTNEYVHSAGTPSQPAGRAQDIRHACPSTGRQLQSELASSCEPSSCSIQPSTGGAFTCSARLHHTCLQVSPPHNPCMSLQEAARPHSLAADLAQILASAIQHGVLPAVDMLGLSDEQWFPLGWASAAAADPNAAVPLSHLVRIQAALGCDPGDC